VGAHAFIAAEDLAFELTLADGIELDGVLDADLGVETDRNRARFTLPALRAGESRSFVVGVHVPPSRGARSVARASLATATLATGGHVTGRAEISIGFGTEAAFGSSESTGVVLDLDLGERLDAAADAISRGDGTRAAAELKQHVRLVRARTDLRANVRVNHRTDAVERVATAIDALFASATHTERRELGLALGGLAVRFGR
jgi:hypothetical protein